jgi:hypothetical protein
VSRSDGWRTVQIQGNVAPVNFLHQFTWPWSRQSIHMPIGVLCHGGKNLEDEQCEFLSFTSVWSWMEGWDWLIQHFMDNGTTVNNTAHQYCYSVTVGYCSISHIYCTRCCSPLHFPLHWRGSGHPTWREHKGSALCLLSKTLPYRLDQCVADRNLMIHHVQKYALQIMYQKPQMRIVFPVLVSIHI